MKVIRITLIFLFLFTSFSYLAMGSVIEEENKREILEKLYKIKLPFVENKGQIKDKSVRYYAKTFAGTVFVTKDANIVYLFSRLEREKKINEWAVKESFIKCSPSNVKGEEKAVTKVNYFKGKDPLNWKRAVSTYNLISLGEPYQGIEVKLKAYGKNIEKLFYIKPGANLKNIKVKIEGANDLRINEKGELEVITGLGPLRFTKPTAYQYIGGKRVNVEVAYLLYKGETYGFKVGSYDKKKLLIIDPLLSSTCIGGSSYEDGHSIALDGSGNVYVTGGTHSPDYPVTPGAYDENINGAYDIFISKLNSDLSTLLSSTHIGGSSYDDVYSICLDGSGNVYVTGRTGSPDYPVTPGAYDETHNVFSDVFISKLNSDLSTLLSSTFIGGLSDEAASSIALDGSGNVYVTGGTYSSDYPVTPGAYDETNNGWAVFISKLNSDLSTLLSSTFIGGASEALSICLDGSGNVYVTGRTESSDYPVTPGAYDESHNGSNDVFVSKLNGSLSSLLASTFIGGSSHEDSYSIALDGSGNVYVTGGTYSSDYPVTPGAYDETHNGGYDVFISKLNSDLSTLLSSTFIGGSSYEYNYSIALDGSGNVYVTGGTYSSDYPVTPGAYDESFNGEYDVFISKLNSDLSTLLSSTFIGPGFAFSFFSICLDGNGNVYVTGSTDSPDYPTTPGAYDESCDGQDVFVSKLNSDLSTAPDLTGEWTKFNVYPKKKRTIISGELTVRNIGTENTGSFKVAYYLSNDRVLDGGDSLIETKTVRSLRAGKSRKLGLVYSSKDPLQGNFIIAEVDSDNQVLESDEENNIATSPQIQ